MTVNAAVGAVLAMRPHAKNNHITAYLVRQTLPVTSGAAMPPVLRRNMTGVPVQQHTGLLQALAICAACREVPQVSKPLGACFAELDVAPALYALTTLALPQAATVLRGLITRAGSANFYDLADLLAHWEDGLPHERMERRTRVLTDYLTWRN